MRKYKLKFKSEVIPSRVFKTKEYAESYLESEKTKYANNQEVMEYLNEVEIVESNKTEPLKSYSLVQVPVKGFTSVLYTSYDRRQVERILKESFSETDQILDIVESVVYF